MGAIKGIDNGFRIPAHSIILFAKVVAVRCRVDNKYVFNHESLPSVSTIPLTSCRTPPDHSRNRGQITSTNPIISTPVCPAHKLRPIAWIRAKLDPDYHLP